MHGVYIYFETIPPAHRSVILVLGLTFFWVLEYFIPFFQLEYNKWKHAGVNLFFTLTTILINLPLAFILLKTSDWSTANDFGVLQWLSPMPLWGQILLGTMILDFIGSYLAHWIEHKVKLLWGFHLIHHSDHKVDVTTANRHHPGESMLRFVFTCFGVLIVGAPVALIMIYQALSVVLSQFNHANISMSHKVDDLMSWIIVTPNMHKVHHHHKLPYTDSNYGNIFSIWDRIFGTYLKLSKDQIVYGVDTCPCEKENSNAATLLKLPFKPYKHPER